MILFKYTDSVRCPFQCIEILLQAIDKERDLPPPAPLTVARRHVPTLSPLSILTMCVGIGPRRHSQINVSNTAKY